MSVTTFTFPDPKKLPREGPGGVARVTLPELIEALSDCSDSPHEVLAAAVHMVIKEKVHLVTAEPAGGSDGLRPYPGDAAKRDEAEDGGRDAGGAEVAELRSRRGLGRVIAPLCEVVVALGCVLALCLAVAGHAAESPPTAAVPDEVRSCTENALGQRFCAPDPSGTAVLDDLGEPHCAAGDCVRVDGDWHCSTRPGGSARVTREKTPECDGGCAAPEPTYCEAL